MIKIDIFRKVILFILLEIFFLIVFYFILGRLFFLFSLVIVLFFSFFFLVYFLEPLYQESLKIKEQRNILWNMCHLKEQISKEFFEIDSSRLLLRRSWEFISKVVLNINECHIILKDYERSEFLYVFFSEFQGRYTLRYSKKEEYLENDMDVFLYEKGNRSCILKIKLKSGMLNKYCTSFLNYIVFEIYKSFLENLTSIKEEKINQTITNVESLDLYYYLLLPQNIERDHFSLECFFSKGNKIHGDWFSYTYQENRDILDIVLIDSSMTEFSWFVFSGILHGAFRTISSQITMLSLQDRIIALRKSFEKAVLGFHSNNLGIGGVFLSIDLKTGSMCYMNMGYIPPCLKTQQKVTRCLGQTSRLGINQHEFEIFKTNLIPGDLLLISSDGLYKNTSKNGVSSLHFIHVKRWMLKCHNIQELMKILKEETLKFWQEGSCDEDVSWILFQYKSLK